MLIYLHKESIALSIDCVNIQIENSLIRLNKHFFRVDINLNYAVPVVNVDFIYYVTAYWINNVPSSNKTRYNL